MKNIYHSDIYKFNTPVKSYWEDNSQENLNLEKLTKDVKSEIVVIGGGKQLNPALREEAPQPIFPASTKITSKL